MTPQLSFTIWFTQRTGSTLLCKSIESTGIAGNPREWFNCKPDLLEFFHQTNHADLQAYLWKLGTTPNGVFGNNHSFYEPHFSQLTETLRKFPLGKKQYSLRHTGHCASVTSRLRRWFDKGHLHRVTAPFSLRQPNVNAGQEAPPSDPF